MPAYCTHYIFACELLPALTELAGFDLNRDAVMLGTQGPDVFFFHRIAPWMPGRSQRKIGSRLHRAKPGDILDAMAEYCTRCSTEKDIARSYAYGFILHYALDRQCHPFVYAKQQELTDSGSSLHKSALHNIVEMSMDAVLLHEKLHIDDPRCFDTAVTVPDDPAVLDEVARLLSFTVYRVLGKRLQPTDARRALTDTKTMQRLLRDANGSKARILGGIETILSPFTGNFRLTSMLRPKDLEKAKKYGNIENRNWRSPYAPGVRTESFFDLYRLAQAPAQEMIRGFDRICAGETDGAAVTQNLSFLTGVEVK